jgi:FMN phosphatase YigB (HAD superfamily)
MPDSSGLTAVFFDIGNTLGAVNAQGDLVPFEPGTRALLSVMRGVLGLRLGVITNLPDSVSHNDIKKLLNNAGLLQFVDPAGLITNHDAGVDKPDPKIYKFAASSLGVPVDRCLYVGEDADEVAGARKAGMAAIRKPFPAEPPA